MKNPAFRVFCLQISGLCLLYWSILHGNSPGSLLGLGAILGSAVCSLFR